MIWTLILKDIRQHRKPLLILATTALLLSTVTSAGAAAGHQMEGVYGFAFGFLIIAAPVILTTWFVGDEKVKGTIRVLRLLPISSRTLMAAKMLGIILVIESLLLGTMVLVPMVVGMVIGYPLYPTCALVLSFLAMPLLCISVLLPVFVHYEYKIAGQFAFGTFFGISMLLLIVVKKFPDVGQKISIFLSHSDGLRVLALVLWLCSLASLAVGWFAASRIYEWKEWSDLGED